MINHFAMEFQVFLVFVALSVSMLASVYGIELSGEAYWKMNLGSDTNMPKVVKDALLETRTTTLLGSDAKRAQAHAQQLSETKFAGGNDHYANGAKAYGQQLSETKTTTTTRNYKKRAQAHAQQLSETKFAGGNDHYANGAKAYEQQLSETKTTASFGNNPKGSELLTDNIELLLIEKDLIYPRSSVKLHFLMGDQKAKFMPSEVVNSMPFSSAKLPEILKFFAVKPGSQNAKLIEEEITLCESKAMEGEEKSCENSLEGMVNYAKSKLGKQIVAVSTEVNEETKQEYKIKSITKIYNDQNVVCHKMVYPYAVFYCHTLSKTDTYKVSLVDSTGKKVRAVAVCHKDTLHWNPEHIAFQFLKVKPGSVHICHFLNPDSVVWVPKY